MEPKTIVEKIEEEGCWGRVLSSYGKGRLAVYDKKITSGIVYDTVDEFMGNLKAGVTYDDMLEGYNMSTQLSEKLHTYKVDFDEIKLLKEKLSDEEDLL